MSLKEEVLQMISAIDNEDLLNLVKADIEYFNKNDADIFEELNINDRQELLNLIEEPDEKDVLTEDEYKAATSKWRIK